MALFGKRKLAYDGPASSPLAFENAQPIAPMGQMPDIQTPSLPTQKQGFFGQGGFGRYLAGALGDTLARNAGMGTPFLDSVQQQQKQQYEDQLYQRRSAEQWAQFVKRQEYRAANPTPDDYDRELAANGIYPGTPEYAKHRANHLRLKDDPVHMINGPDGGPILVGGPYGYPGQPPAQSDGYDELPPGYQVGGGEGGPYQPVQPTYNNVVDPAGEAAMIKALGPAGYQQWRRKYGLQVMGNR